MMSEVIKLEFAVIYLDFGARKHGCLLSTKLSKIQFRSLCRQICSHQMPSNTSKTRRELHQTPSAIANHFHDNWHQTFTHRSIISMTPKKPPPDPSGDGCYNAVRSDLGLRCGERMVRRCRETGCLGCRHVQLAEFKHQMFATSFSLKSLWNYQMNTFSEY